MNEADTEFTPFERQLREFRPARPSEELMARLDNRCDAAPSHRRIDAWSFVRFLSFSAAGVAALVLILVNLFFVRHGHPSIPYAAENITPSATVPEKPLVWTGSTVEVIAARDDGIYTDADGRPIQLSRQIELKRSVWKDPRTGNMTEVLLPRQRLLVKYLEIY